MAQKVNSLNLRLNKRLNWNTLMCTHNFNDYYNNIINSTSILNTSKKMLYDIKSLQNTTIVTKTSKNYKVNSKYLNQQFFFYLLKIVCTTKRTTQNFYQYRKNYLKVFQNILKFFLFNHKQLIIQLSDMNKQKKFEKQVHFDKKFMSLSPTLITEFVNSQLSTTTFINLTSNNFNKTLQKSLLNLIEIILQRFKYNILGVKIICVGKWKKTNTGRKQKIYLKYGQIQTSNLANKILYHNISQTTKFGVCSVKIWIAHKT